MGATGGQNALQACRRGGERKIEVDRVADADPGKIGRTVGALYLDVLPTAFASDALGGIQGSGIGKCTVPNDAPDRIAGASRWLRPRGIRSRHRGVCEMRVDAVGTSRH